MSDAADSTPRPAPRADAREVATRVLHRVDVDCAYAAAALQTELQSLSDPRDVGLATEIVYGALRCLPSLDAAVRGALSDPNKKLDPWVRATFRVAAYQILHLGRVPVHAAVDRAVAIASAKRGTRLGGFVNAVLRRVAAQRPEAPSPPTKLEVPPWLKENLERALGAERAAAFLGERRLPPPIGLRLVRGAAADDAIGRIREAQPGAEVTPVVVDAADRPISVEGAMLVRGASNPRLLPGYAEGNFTIQELGAQLVLRAVAIPRGASVADVCAGRGGKTLLALESVGPEGRVVAFDIDERKLEEIHRERTRLALPGVLETEPVDFAVGTGGFADEFDVVLVDAPCSGIGTVHRRPEMLLRLSPKDPDRLGALQTKILANARKLVRPGGLLLFAVCSPTAAEGPGVLKRFEAAHPEFRREPIPTTAPLLVDPDGLVRIGPWMGDVDAYQVAVWRRVSEV